MVIDEAREERRDQIIWGLLGYEEKFIVYFL